MLDLSFFTGPRKSYGIFGVSATRVASAGGEFAALMLQASATQSFYVLSVGIRQASIGFYLGKLAVDILDGAAKDALDGAVSSFGGVRTAMPFVGFSTITRAPDGYLIDGHATNQQRHALPVPLYIEPGEFFFIIGDTVNEALNASVLWLEA